MKVIDTKITNVWVAYVSPDDRRSQVYGYYDSYYKALQSVIGKSWYGSNGTVNQTPVDAITLTFEDGSKMSFLKNSQFTIETETAQDKEARMKQVQSDALAKLSYEEKQALGLV